MEKIKKEQANVLKDIIGKKWKNIPHFNLIATGTFGVKIKDGDIIGLGLFDKKLTVLPESIGNLTCLEELWLDNNQLIACLLYTSPSPRDRS